MNQNVAQHHTEFKLISRESGHSISAIPGPLNHNVRTNNAVHKTVRAVCSGQNKAEASLNRRGTRLGNQPSVGISDGSTLGALLFQREI